MLEPFHKGRQASASNTIQPGRAADFGIRSLMRLLTRYSQTATTRKKRRMAEFDWSLLRKSVSLNGPTDIALTFVDYIDIDNRKARRFEQLTSETVRFIEEVERVASAPVSLITTRFDYRSIIDRRAC
jgi:adenylosuccinate synthase